MRRIVVIAAVCLVGLVCLLSGRASADVKTNCPEAVKDALLAKAPTATELACTENRAAGKWVVEITLPKLERNDKKPAPKLLVETAKDGTVDLVKCPAAVLQAIQRRFPGTTTATCWFGDTDKQLSVELPQQAHAQVWLDGSIIGLATEHADRVESSGVLMAMLFWLFALATVGGAIFVITRRNLIAAVMGVIGSFVGIAAVYMMLYASFLSVIQMLVYAGAIMVLFVFVIMILNRPEDEPVAPSGRAGQVVGGVAILYLVGRLVMLLMRVQPPIAKSGDAWHVAPAALPVPPTNTIVHDWGSVKAVGTDLFNAGLFPFEAISILLLIAVVGAIAIARPLKEDEP